jgi:glycosyltransferase involved in cell wall biosynthesis
MKILMVTPSLPYPADTGGAIRTYELLKRVAAENETDLIGLAAPASGSAAPPELAKLCRRVYSAAKPAAPRLLQAPVLLGKALRGVPFITKYADSPHFTALLRQAVRENAYGVIHFEKSMVAGYVERLPAGHGAKTVLGLQDVGFIAQYRMYRHERRLRRKLRLLLNWLPMLSWEPRMARLFDKTLVVSENDRVLMQALEPGLDIAVIPNGIDTRTRQPYPLAGRDKNILLLGSLDYPPNIDAVRFFCGDIFPAVKQRVPACTLAIVGRNPGPEVQQLAVGPGVTLHANVDDVAPFYKRASVLVVPLRSGSGTRLKILEAMAFGTPVVATRVGREGLDVADGRDLLVADAPADFAAKVCEALSSAERWQALARSGRELVQSKYDWDLIGARLCGVYRELAA